MARQYPRFLLSYPVDTKSSGVFITHTLFPQLLAKITFAEDGFHQVQPLEEFTHASKDEFDQVVYAMHNWYSQVRMKRAGLSGDFYVRCGDIAARLSSNTFLASGTVTSSMVFKPKMGALIGIGKDDWKVSVNFRDSDNYDSVVTRLKEQYKLKYHFIPSWNL